MSNLQMRLITAACLIAIVLALTWVGGLAFHLLTFSVGAAIFYEWQMLTCTCQTFLGRVVGWIFYLLIAALLLFDAPANIVFINIMVAAFVLAVLGRAQACWWAGGLLYALAAPVTLSLIRDGAAGMEAVFFLYGVVWATDSAAYFSGRALGGPKLAPKISPNKTWSGALAGTGAALIVSFIMVCLMANFTLSLPLTLILAFVLSIVSQIGDIGESWLKRHFNVKDSGTILPGHGGFMDRADGLIVSAVIFYLFVQIFSLS